MNYPFGILEFNKLKLAPEVGLERLDVPKTAENYCFSGVSSITQIAGSVSEIPSGTKAGPLFSAVEGATIVVNEALNRPALLQARQRAQGVSRGGLGGVDFAIRHRFL